MLISECKKRDLRLKRDALTFLKHNKLMEPFFNDDGLERYHPIQILQVAEVFRLRDIFGSISDNPTEYAEHMEELGGLIQLLAYLYYTHQDKVLGYSTIKESVYGEAMFVPEKPTDDYTEEYISKKRDAFATRAFFIDPMREWYVFLRTIRLNDPQKFKTVRGSVLLAHDYYIAAELLTLYYREQFGTALLPIEDMRDGRAGSWKQKNCIKCDIEFPAKTLQEQYCNECKSEVAQTLEGAWRCKCGEGTLLKFLDGSELLNETSTWMKKRKHQKGSNKTPINIAAIYGKSIVFATCNKCGETSYRTIERGWI